MFDKFGELGSAEEINELAKNLLQEGDMESLEQMAKENGIGSDFVEMFREGAIPYLCDANTAANGKLDIECASLELKGLMVDWVEYIRSLCMEKPDMAAAVRAKGKSLAGCMGILLKYSFENRITVSKEIVETAGIKAAKVDFGVPDMGTAKKLIRQYYLGGGR